MIFLTFFAVLQYSKMKLQTLVIYIQRKYLDERNGVASQN